jgi:hypothetical protein
MSTDLSTVRLLVASPAYNGVSNNYFHSCQKLRTALNNANVFSQFVTVPNVPVDAARDAIGNEFLRLSRTPKGFSHLLMSDNDIGSEVDTVFRMIARDVDFAAAAAPLRRLNWAAVARAAAEGKKNPERFAATFAVNLLDNKLSLDQHGFARIEDTGGAFLLLRPRVFEVIREKNPHLVHHRPDGSEETMFFRPDVIDDRRCGEDVAFQRRWRKAGGDIWLIVDAPLTHEGPHTFTGNYRDLTSLGQ